MIKYYKRTLRDKRVKSILRAEVGCWVNVIDPSSEEVDFLVKKFKLDRKNLESGLDQNELPRIDIVKKNIYVFAKHISSHEEREIETYLIVITKNFILTLSKSRPYFLRKIFSGKIKFISTQKLKCIISIFSAINASFEKLTYAVVKKVKSERKPPTHLSEKDLYVLLKQEEILNSLVSSYYYMNLLYARMVKKIKFFDQDKAIIEDLITEARQGLNLCRSSLKNISNIRKYYDISLSSKLNRIITVLTVFTIVISIPAAISGIYGMNVLLPLQENRFAFYIILGFIAFVCLCFIWYLKKKRII